MDYVCPRLACAVDFSHWTHPGLLPTTTLSLLPPQWKSLGIDHLHGEMIKSDALNKGNRSKMASQTTGPSSTDSTVMF